MWMLIQRRIKTIVKSSNNQRFVIYKSIYNLSLILAHLRLFTCKKMRSTVNKIDLFSVFVYLELIESSLERQTDSVTAKLANHQPDVSQLIYTVVVCICLSSLDFYE